MDEFRSVQGWVSGRVQGVAYRASLQREAQRLGVTGWVRNTADGRVEYCAHGPAAAVAALLEWARTGPRFARVDQLHEQATVEPVADTFEIRM